MEPVPSGGYIACAEQAGFPGPLLIPCMPFNVHPDLSPGKAPARLTASGMWVRLKDWRGGSALSPEEMARADRAGSNVGLVLGAASGAWQYVFLDFDTEPGPQPGSADWRVAHFISSTALQVVCEALGLTRIWVRETRPGRAGVAIRMPADQDPGPKAVLKMFSKSADGPVRRGKIELLSRGQQAVIGGRHVFNNGSSISWYLHDRPGIRQPAPAVGDESFPVVKSREDLERVVSAIVEKLTACHVVFDNKTLTAGSHGVGDKTFTRLELAPKNYRDLVALLDAMPHDSRTEYDEYVWIMRAVAGCLRALEADGDLSDMMEAQVVEAAVGWASRWAGSGKGTSYADEKQRWENNFSKSPAEHIPCWEALVRRAMELGNTGLRDEWIRIHADEIESEFADELDTIEEARALGMTVSVDAPPIPRASDAGREVIIEERTPGLVHIEDSDLMFADHAEKHMRNVALHIVERDMWMTWGGVKAGWRLSKMSNAQVMQWCESLNARYVVGVGQLWPESKKLKGLSNRHTANIESALRFRLAYSVDDINQDRGFIQTPDGAYDLTTLTRLSSDAQCRLLDTRSTRKAPAAGACPMFDNLLLSLACGDTATWDWLWLYLGYTLTGRPLSHIMLVIYGPGGNGKGTLDKVMQALLGDYAVALDRAILMESGRGKHETGLNEIRGHRYWSVSELQQNEKWNEAQLRALTGGDKIKARGMRENMSSIDYEGSFLITCNFLPRFYQIDNAIVRRFRLIHARLTVANPDRTIAERIIEQEGPAILQRLMTEASRYLRDPAGIDAVPEAMLREAKRYFGEQDRFHEWFTEHLKPAFGQALPIASLKASFDAHMARVAEDNDEDPSIASIGAVGERSFVASLEKAGVVTTDAAGRRLYRMVDGRKVAYCEGVTLRP